MTSNSIPSKSTVRSSAGVTPSASAAGSSGDTHAANSVPEALFVPAKDYGRLPISFEANRGQTDAQVKYVSHGRGYTLFLTDDEAVLSLGRDKKTAGLRMRMVGANHAATLSGQQEVEGKSNYFIGNDPKKWVTGVPNYSQVKYESAYPGVDLVYYGTQQQLEYDFVVAPGTDPGMIALDFSSSSGSMPAAKTYSRRILRIADNGDLRVAVERGEVRLHKPVVYQEIGNKQDLGQTVARHSVDGRWVIRNKTQVGFEVGDYDRSRSLVIDPVLVYSSYLGGNSADVGNGVAVDSSGNAYLTGRAQSTNFPVFNGGFQTTNGGVSDAFVTKLDPSGSKLIYSTFIGGSGSDIGFALALDQASGNVYITGATSSNNFPITPGAYQSVCGGGCTGTKDSAVFVTGLNSTGSALLYSTYLGGSTADNAIAISIAEDASGNAYVTGKTSSPTFPTTPGAFQTTFGGTQNVFVAKFNATGTTLVYSTYLGGSGKDSAIGIKVDAAGSAYVTGNTTSANFPVTAGAFQTTCANNCTKADAFVTKLNPAGSAPVYSTLMGGSDSDNGLAIALDAANNAYITGFTCSTDLPTTVGAFQRTYGGGKCSNSGGDAFVAKFNATGSALVYSTYIGGSATDGGFAIAVSSTGTAWVSGDVGSSNFPVTPGAFQTSLNGTGDVFIAEVSPNGSALLYSTYFGGSGTEVSYAIAVDSAGNPYVTGKTTSADFPVTPGAFQTTYGGGNSDAFLVRLVPGDQAWPLNLDFGSVVVGSTSNILVTKLSNSTSNSMTIASVAITGTDASDFSQTNNCGTSLAAGATCDISVTFTPTVVGVRTAAVTISDGAPNSPQTVALGGTGAPNPVTLTPAQLTFPTITVGQSSAPQVATLSNIGTTTVTISSIMAAGPYGETTTCGTTLAPSANCTISVVFNPAGSGTQAGTLTVTDSVPGGSQVTTLTGVGTLMSFMPGSLNFGNQAKGTSSQPQTVRLQNVGTTTMRINKISITGARVSSYSETNTCASTLAPGASCTASVTFTPRLLGALDAALTVADSGGGSPQNLPLTGTGR